MSAILDAAKVQASVDKITARCLNLANSLGTTKTMQLQLPEADKLHLFWFDAGTSRGQPPRPTLGLDDAAREVAYEAIRARALMNPDGSLNTLVALGDAGHAIARHYADRLEAGGGDRVWVALSPAYARRKARLGQPTHPGVATGALVRSLRGAFVIVRNA